MVLSAQIFYKASHSINGRAVEWFLKKEIYIWNLQIYIIDSFYDVYLIGLFAKINTSAYKHIVLKCFSHFLLGWWEELILLKHLHLIQKKELQMHGRKKNIELITLEDKADRCIRVDWFTNVNITTQYISESECNKMSTNQ